jgi:hypothetical protein
MYPTRLLGRVLLVLLVQSASSEIVNSADHLAADQIGYSKCAKG